jgi:hypothetical protein
MRLCVNFTAAPPTKSADASLNFAQRRVLYRQRASAGAVLAMLSQMTMKLTQTLMRSSLLIIFLRF